MEEWIVIVDDDAINLQTAKHIFNEAQLQAKYFKSGSDMLKFLDGTRIPNLILLDIHMPEMDGFEVLGKLRTQPGYEKVPVIFLTADDDAATERKGIEAGAVDFVKKPFAAEVLLLRMRKTISLSRLETVYSQTLKALTQAIDTKDTPISGYSSKVAEYARATAERAGYSSEVQEQMYLAGLLHDVSMIGISGSNANKPDRLTEEEFEHCKEAQFDPNFADIMLQIMKGDSR